MEVESFTIFPPDADGQDHQSENAREIGGQAVWTLSSCKQGFAMDQLRDGNLDTYWQSDGLQPHSISVQFPKRQTVLEVCFYVDYLQDESYTPQKISVKAGSHYHDLREITQMSMTEPSGWVSVPLTRTDQTAGVQANLLEITMLSNHQNGRDTHMRQIKVFGPVERGISVIEKFQDPNLETYSNLR
ncbi:anaphase-promoting complex subunit 10 [Sphaeroforma arctica JP610]|uniref:Anaphase-promoting complex subunit 10 n=1 Tax=Sphaeroforma arctica JP610 TaxID=667725 RepID=A0A0L0GFR7_9EUKA|nr:anaphase-promoting complex subunit 10 [Sphaeroforma arctica JP610]KNC87681.1 anaphase-promoting complex subunit 10 [Sphaeroforma arctica JP610]|eukprot:XP_014161583.1 anaphase-promoting complex subunit 10 [Sphaeroforma arctica JP610]